MENKTPYNQPLKIGQTEIPHRLILAPMCGITLKPFRKICKEFGAGLVFDQMVSAKALTMEDQKSFKLMEFDEGERPMGLQVFGNNAETLAEASKIIQDQNPDVIDLNLGCPAKKIVNDGGGSALLSDLNKLSAILGGMRKAITGTFTIKIRAGWDEKSKNAMDVAKLAVEEGVDAIAIHARTRAQGYSGHSDWDFIKHLKNEIPQVPIIGNGDVKCGRDAIRMMQETGCDAVMTGRGAFEAPWIFKDFLENSDEQLPSPEQRYELITKQYQYAIEFHGEATGIKMMRKHICAYTKGLRNGNKFRQSIIKALDFALIEDELKKYFIDTNWESAA